MRLQRLKFSSNRYPIFISARLRKAFDIDRTSTGIRKKIGVAPGTFLQYKYIDYVFTSQNTGNIQVAEENSIPLQLNIMPLLKFKDIIYTLYCRSPP